MPSVFSSYDRDAGLFPLAISAMNASSQAWRIQGTLSAMPSAPPVGVVIANHNNEAYIERAIESAANQSVRDLCIVVVDDASTDGSDEAIRRCLSRLGDGRIRHLKLENNVGQGGAVRRGMAMLDAPFVSFLDADDVWYESFVARHLAAHLNADFPVALTYCDSHIVDGHDRLLAGTAWFFDSVDLLDRTPRRIEVERVPVVDGATGRVSYPPQPAITLYPHWSPARSTNTTSGMMFRRSFVDLVMRLPDEDLRLYVDFYLSTFACLLTGSAAIHEALYGYRMHGNNRHSDASVPGGAYNSSSRPWGPIRDTTLAMIQKVLRSEGEEIRRIFGEDRHELALMLVAEVLGQTAAESVAVTRRWTMPALLSRLRSRM
jgi:glycosyltransferase involved in cell wall biosynthesis